MTLRLSDVPPAFQLPEATATNDEEERRNTRTVCFLIPPNEDFENARLSPAADEKNTNNEIEVKVKGARVC